MKNERLQKVLARLGIGSRREIERWIVAKRITVNDKVAELGVQIDSSDKVSIDGHAINLSAAAAIRSRVILYNKPKGEICTRSDPEGRPTVFENLPHLEVGRWVAIGRLDINSEGLLLFTNDGELANALMHPKAEIEREYLTRVYGYVDTKVLSELQHGVKLDDGMAKFKNIYELEGRGTNQWFRVVVTEGRNRLVRRLWEAKKIAVSRLIRVRFCDILLPRSLIPGKFMELGAKDVKLLLELKA